MRDEDLTQVLERAARSDRGVRFLDRQERETRLTYREILDSARSTAGGLQARGVGPGDRVGIIHPTEPAFFDAFFGCLLAGATPVPLYPPVRLGRLDEYHERTAAMLRAASVKLVLTDPRTRRVLGPTIERALPPLGCELTSDLPRAACSPVAVAPDDVAFIQFSSGTTTDPKPIRLSHRGVRANIAAILTSILSVHPERGDAPHVCVSWLPLYHDMGLVGAVLTAMAHPGELVLIPPELFVARPAIWLRAISRYRGTISPAPNFAYALCAERVSEDELDTLDLSSWSVAMNGAEPVTPDTLDRFVARFARCGLAPEALTPVYGLAEATLAVTFSDLRRPFGRERFDRVALFQDGRAVPDADGQELVSLGRPLPGFEIHIRADDGAPLGADRVGRVWVRGPSLMQGYDGSSDATPEVLQDGCLDTGDVGFLHDEELYLCARAKDVIVLRGRKYAPQDVEHAADEVEGVRTGCAVAVGLVDEQAGEQLAIFAERARGDTSSDLAERLRKHVIRRTGLVPELVILLEPGTLPRTSSGKIRRAETRRRHLLGELTPPSAMNLARLSGAMLRSTLSFARLRRRA